MTHITSSGPFTGALGDIFEFVKFINKFRHVRRTILCKGEDDPERVGEHSFQLLLVGMFIQQRFRRELDLEKVMWCAIVHDLPEVYAEDTPAFPDPENRLGVREDLIPAETKDERERIAIKRIEREWGNRFPELLHWLHHYNEAANEEARFIYALDKFIADLNIYEDDGRTNIELGVTFDAKVAYKRPRIAHDDWLAELYEEFLAHCREREDELYHTEDTAAE